MSNTNFVKPDGLLKLEKKLGVEIEENTLGFGLIFNTFKVRDEKIIGLMLAVDEIDFSDLLFVECSLEELSLNIVSYKHEELLLNFTKLCRASLYREFKMNHLILNSLANVEILTLTQFNVYESIDLSNLRKLKYLEFIGCNFSEFPKLNFSNIEILWILDSTFSNWENLSLCVNLRSLTILFSNFNNLELLLRFNKIEKVRLIGTLVNTISEKFCLNFNWLNYSVEDSPNVYGQLSVSNSLSEKFENIIREGGREGLLAYYKNLRESQSQFLEAKLIILGEPDAGKTSLVRYIHNLPFQTEKSVTKGINISNWTIQDEKHNDIRINIWDFGGQEIQQAIHQYFITDDTFYIILLDAIQDQKPEKYLKYLESYAKNAPFFIVVNKMDLDEKGNANFRIALNEISTKYQDLFKDYFKISLRKASANNDSYQKEELDKLIIALKSEILKLRTIYSEVPKSYIDVKRSLEDFYQNTKSPYITYDSFVQICKDKEVVQDTEEFVLAELNCLGTIRYINKRYLKSLQLLNPEWLSEGIYRILTHSRTNLLFGILNKTDLNVIFQKLPNDVFEYRPDQFDYLIEMMRSYKVAFYDENTEQIFIPAAFNDDIPNNFDRGKYVNDALYVFLGFEQDIPAHIIHSFIVEMFKDVQPELYWYKGTLLKDSRNPEPNKALVEWSDRKINLWIQGTYIQQYLGIILNKFEILLKNIAIKYQIKFKVDENEIVELDTLYNLLKRGKKEYHGKYKDYIIEDLLNKVETKTKQDNILHRQEVPDFRLKTISIFLASSSELKEERIQFELMINRLNKEKIGEGLFFKLEIWEDFIDAMSKTRLQDEYNATIKGCHIFVSLFATKVGKYTIEEFGTAHGHFKENSYPLIYTYFKDVKVSLISKDEDEFVEYKSFQKKLSDLGHFYTVFESSADLENKFKSQLNKILPKFER